MNQIEPRPIVMIAGNPALTGDLYDAVVKKGLQAAGPFRSNAEALSWAELWTPDIAILNSTFDEARNDELANLLRRHGVLVLVCNEVDVCSKPPAHYVDGRRLQMGASVSRSELENT